MANNEWMKVFENGVCIHKDMGGKKPFRFFNIWASSDGFLDLVRDVWQRPVTGCRMYKVTQKMKMLKIELKKYNQAGFSDIQAKLSRFTT